jgi:hypothetical protein
VATRLGRALTKKFVCFVGALLLSACGTADTDVAAVEQQLAKAMPPQSTLAQVLDYLNGEKIEHSQYLHDPASGNSIGFIIRRKSSWTLVRTDYSIIIYFDDRTVWSDTTYVPSTQGHNV